MKPAITDIAGIGPAAATALAEHGFSSIESISATSVEKLALVPGFSTARAAKVIAAASALAPAAADSQPGKKDKGAKKDKKKEKGGKGKKGKKDKKGKKGKKK